MKLSCLGFALFVGALINDSAFLESKQHVEEIQSETIYSKPLLWPWLWSEQDSLISLRVRQGEETAGGHGAPPEDREAAKEKVGPRQNAGPAENTNIWCVERSQDYGSYKQDLQKLQIIPRHQHETINSHFPSSSESNLIHWDLTHSDFPIVPYHHQTLSLS